MWFSFLKLSFENNNQDSTQRNAKTTNLARKNSQKKKFVPKFLIELLSRTLLVVFSYAHRFQASGVLGTGFHQSLLQVSTRVTTIGKWILEFHTFDRTCLNYLLFDRYFVPPCSGTLTCFAGDTLQYLTNDILLSTPHKVRLNTRERFALAYFHEPNFNATIRPIVSDLILFEFIYKKFHIKGAPERRKSPKAWARVNPLWNTLHQHGKLFIMGNFVGILLFLQFMRCYPDRVTTQRIKREGGLEHLKRLHDGGANCMLQPTHFVSSYWTIKRY